jgi:branched-chain amino acid transport system substrate-binding protein
MNKVALWSAVFLVIGLLAGSGVTYFALPSGTTTTSGLSGQIPIGVLCPLTGSQAGQGQACKNAIEMGVNDVNAYLKSINITAYSFVAKTEDTQTDPAVALSDMQSLASTGVKLFGGFQTSAELVNVQAYAKANNLIVTSGGSTTTQLDYVNRGPIFRLIPPNSFEGGGLADAAKYLGFTCFATIAQNSAYGVDLTGTFVNDTKALGGTILSRIVYDTTTTDFSSQLSQLNDAVQQGISQCGADKTAIQVTAFAELEPMLTQAAASYPNLMKVSWFGSGGNNNAAIIQAESQQVLQIHLYTPTYAPPSSSKYIAWAAAYHSAYGAAPLAYAPLNYDAVWIMALSVIETGSVNGAAIAAVFPKVAASFYGASGWTALDANGDRAALTVWISQGAMVNGKANLVPVLAWDPVSNSVSPVINGTALF